MGDNLIVVKSMEVKTQFNHSKSVSNIEKLNENASVSISNSVNSSVTTDVYMFVKKKIKNSLKAQKVSMFRIKFLFICATISYLIFAFLNSFYGTSKSSFIFTSNSIKFLLKSEATVSRIFAAGFMLNLYKTIRMNPRIHAQTMVDYPDMETVLSASLNELNQFSLQYSTSIKMYVDNSDASDFSALSQSQNYLVEENMSMNLTITNYIRVVYLNLKNYAHDNSTLGSLTDFFQANFVSFLGVLKVFYKQLKTDYLAGFVSFQSFQYWTSFAGFFKKSGRVFVVLFWNFIAWNWQT